MNINQHNQEWLSRNKQGIIIAPNPKLHFLCCLILLCHWACEKMKYHFPLVAWNSLREIHGWIDLTKEFIFSPFFFPSKIASGLLDLMYRFVRNLPCWSWCEHPWVCVEMWTRNGSIKICGFDVLLWGCPILTDGEPESWTGRASLWRLWGSPWRREPAARGPLVGWPVLLWEARATGVRAQVLTRLPGVEVKLCPLRVRA